MFHLVEQRARADLHNESAKTKMQFSPAAPRMAARVINRHESFADKHMSASAQIKLHSHFINPQYPAALRDRDVIQTHTIATAPVLDIEPAAINSFPQPQAGPSTTETKPQTGRLVEMYAYSFWRMGPGPSGQLGNGQYGGSQSAFLIAVPLRKFRDAKNVTRLAVIGRLSTAHGEARESEWAAGLRWHPINSVPAQLSVERRFRHKQPDVVAAYISGGYEDNKLPLGFTSDGFGQAGYVSGQDSGAFIDVQLTTHRPLIRHNEARLSAGGGIWGGGQDKVRRLDVGPSLRAVVPAGPAALRIDASWRMRVAGNVPPDSGPTITLSTSF